MEEGETEVRREGTDRGGAEVGEGAMKGREREWAVSVPFGPGLLPQLMNQGKDTSSR